MTISLDRRTLATLPRATRVEPVAVRYLGPLITDTSIPGERKADGIIPAHPGGGALRVARDRWVVFFATLDPAGWDCNHSIVYQLRRDAPDGPVLAEGLIDRGVDGWDPLGRGDRLVKSCGMPIAFGVPRGACLHGEPLAHANVFVVKWYRWAHRRDGERILHPGDRAHQWADGLAIKHQTLRVEWAQFRLKDASDDIELLTQPGVLRQRGHEVGEAFCSLGSQVQMNHAMKPPVAEDAACRSWVSVDTFPPYANRHHDHGTVAPVRMTFNDATGLYEWTDTGRAVSLPDRVIGEASVNRLGRRHVICLRCFEYEHRTSDTCWFSTDDLFGDWGEPTFTPATSVPRIAFTCGDGALRLFSNAPVRDEPHSRAVLAWWEVDPATFALRGPRVVVDARQMGWPFKDPLVDMAKLCPPQGRRQLLLFRVIDRAHTAHVAPDRAAEPAAFAAAGIHAAELTLHRPAPEPWTFL